LTVYVSPIAGATEEIAALRSRYQLISESISELEARVAENTAQLGRLNRSYGDDDDEVRTLEAPPLDGTDIPEEDLQRERAEIRELERKKQALEDRVAGMERDLGGLFR
jgi:chromosome segregation ATPase